jgi:FlaA1/EpsC-like NDP-sugar epimerase
MSFDTSRDGASGSDAGMRSVGQFVRQYALVFTHDTLIGVAAFCLALVLRLGVDLGLPIFVENLWLGLLFGMILAGFTLFFGLSRSIWRYASIADVIRLCTSALLATLVWMAIAFLTIRLTNVPRTAPIIMAMATVLGLVIPRMIYRYYRENRHALPLGSRSRTPAQRVVVIGTDNSAIGFVTASRQDGSRFDVAAMVDWSGQKKGRRIDGRPVHAFNDDLDAVLRQSGKKQPIAFLLVYPPPEGLNQAAVDRLIDLSSRYKVPIRRVHELASMDLSEYTADQRLHTPDILQLLGRRERLTEDTADNGFFHGKRILVTGAGGSIGSELCRQIALRGPAQIATLENSELNLVMVGRQLAEIDADLNVKPILCDVRDEDRLRRAIAEFAPHVIYHAAALKHVPITEQFPEEAVLTNLGGTVAVAEAAKALNVPLVVNISTDKAVNPVNILGLTKRVSEIYLQALDKQGARGAGTRFISVRFGNVIDSSGSVVPLFREQIAKGGPVTVTDPEIERFCMSVSEAVSLVLSSHDVVAEMDGRRGGVIVLDLGQSVKIDMLARQMIRLAGLEPDKNIKIKYIGLREGEKLHEELFHANEERIPTKMKRLLYVNPDVPEPGKFVDNVRGLLRDLETMSEDEIRSSLKKIEIQARRGAPRMHLVQ